MGGEREIRALAKGEGEARWWFGALATIKLTGAETGGSFCLVETFLPPAYRSPRHIHEREDELILVLDGTLHMRNGDVEFTASPGAVVFLPRGLPHGFSVGASQSARYLVQWTPAGIEDLILETSIPARGDDPFPPDLPEGSDLDRITDHMRERYGMRWVADDDFRIGAEP